MRFIQLGLFAALLSGIVACGPAAGESPTTAHSRPATKPDAAFTRIILRDVQGFWGGTDVWLYADGSLVVQLVDFAKKSNPSIRYETNATPLQLASLLALVDKQHFAEPIIPETSAVPDTSHPTITLETKAGTHTVMKWESDTNPRFDPIYAQLLALAKQAAKTDPASKGPYDFAWSPAEKPAIK